jgi:L-fuculose-phosphate aldolase
MGDTPDKALHNAELTERTAKIVWGARALGTPVPLPGKTNENMAGVYRLLRGI